MKDTTLDGLIKIANLNVEAIELVDAKVDRIEARQSREIYCLRRECGVLSNNLERAQKDLLRMEGVNVFWKTGIVLAFLMSFIALCLYAR